MSIKTFEDARVMSFSKWEQILVELNEIENAIGEPCGFCYLGEYQVKQTILLTKCSHCLVEDKCEEYKGEMSKINEFQEWVEGLLIWLEHLEKINTTSRYLDNLLENKGGNKGGE